MTTKQPAILYVEDDPQSRKLMSMLLKGRMKLPHVTILEDSENFQAHVEALDPKPDLILLDIHMKPLNGFEMLTLLREYEWVQNTPIVALTASVMSEEVQRLRSIGFDGCLAKPIDLQTFPETLERILDGEIIWRIIS
ncbi:MAG: response regulator [Chloroflexi bacterium]|nr:response regulator [Chloroflexota bacterium]MCC6897233.1 response regulator [Anaerolineae bacterium]